MATPTTSNNGNKVRITWTQPNYNGAAITSYTITIKNSVGIYTEDTTDCDGS